MRRAQDARDRMSDDTQIGGPSGRFPPTRWSAIVAARGDDPAERTRAFETIVAAYWKPVYKYIRARWGKTNEDAKDLTAEFFARVMEKGFLDSYDPAKSRLRTFLRTCVDGFVANQDKAARRIKRGGDAVLMSLDFQTAEGELARSEPPAPGTMEEFFEKEWIRNLFSLAVERLRAECERAAKRSTFGCSSSTTWRASASRGSPTSTWPASSASRSLISQTTWPLPGASFAASPSQRCAR